MVSSRKPFKIDELCEKAIEHQRSDIEKETTKQEIKKYGQRVSEPTTFVFASKILGHKYFMKHFGRLPIEEVWKIKKDRMNRRRR